MLSLSFSAFLGDVLSLLRTQVTFDPEVKAKSVTLEGDVFDPSGTLTGGE